MQNNTALPPADTAPVIKLSPQLFFDSANSTVELMPKWRSFEKDQNVFIYI